MALALRSVCRAAHSPGHNIEEWEGAPLNEYLASLHPFSVRQRFERNATIFSEGSDALRLYKIIDGVVRICKHTADGRRHIVDFMMPGELFGIVENERHSFTAEAVNDVIAVAYPRHRLDQLGHTNPDIGRRLLAHFYESVLTMQQHLLVLGCQDAKGRLASFLLRLADRTGIAQGERIDLAMGRQDIADHLGLTIETICRSIRDLKDDGALIIPNAHQLILNDVRALRAHMIAN